MEYRAMKSSDREGVQAFFDSLEGDSATFFNWYRGNEKIFMKSFEEDMPHFEFYVLEEAGEIIGVTFLWDTDSRIPWFGIGIRNGWQGKHLGSMMLTETLEMLKKRGCGGLLLTTAQTNYKGQGLYEKCGFEKLGTYPDGEILYLHRFKK